MAGARRRGMIKITGIQEALEALGGPRLYQSAMFEALVKLAEIGRKEAERRSPVGKQARVKGALASSATAIRKFPARGSLPYMASVAVRGDVGVTPKNFRYAFALNASKKIVYKYRMGAFKNRKTLGWWKAATTLERRSARKLIDDVARGVERNFRAAPKVMA